MTKKCSSCNANLDIVGGRIKKIKGQNRWLCNGCYDKIVERNATIGGLAVMRIIFLIVALYVIINPQVLK